MTTPSQALPKLNLNKQSLRAKAVERKVPSSPSQLLEEVVLLGRHHQQQHQQQETPPVDHQVDSTSRPSSSSSSTSAMAADEVQAGKGRKPLPSTPIYDNIHCTHPQVSGYILYKDLRERNLPGPREPGGAYLPKEHVIGNNFCCRCGFWYKKNHSLFTCDTRRGGKDEGCGVLCSWRH